MNRKTVNILIGIAILMILLGGIVAFIDLEKLCIKVQNDGYVSGFFTISGIILYFTALMYQIKEYKLQVVELRKSVEAQTKSSQALDEQKKILLEQNVNSTIFSLIENFNNYKSSPVNQEALKLIAKDYQNLFAVSWSSILQNKRQNKEELNIEFASTIKILFNTTLVGQKDFPIYNRFIQMAYNIFRLIDKNESLLSFNYFTSFFFTQFSLSEAFLLYLSNLSEKELPKYDNLYWGYYDTGEFISFLSKSEIQYFDESEIDKKVLTKEFNKLKHQ